jgi:signal transduction histidine kinase
MLAAWTAYAILTVAYFFSFNPTVNLSLDAISPALVRWTLLGWTWAFLSFPIFAVSRRWPFRRGGVVRALVAHLAAFAVTQIVLGLVDLWIAYLLFHATSQVFYFMFSIARLNLIVFAVLAAGCHAYESGRRSAGAERTASELRHALAEAQLEALRLQLQPHFLFNAIHDISELVYEDPARAERALARLGDLFRASLTTVGRQELPLGEEVEILEAYLEVQRIRFADRFRVGVRMSDDARTVPVPTFLLQPLIENAVRHGQTADGTVEVHVDARVEGEALVLTIADSGPGLRQTGLREGIGLSVTRERLRRLYGTAGSVGFSSSPSGGVTVAIRVPRRPPERIAVTLAMNRLAPQVANGASR